MSETNLATVQRAIQGANISDEKKKQLIGMLRTKKPEDVLIEARALGVRCTLQTKIAKVPHRR